MFLHSLVASVDTSTLLNPLISLMLSISSFSLLFFGMFILCITIQHGIGPVSLKFKILPLDWIELSDLSHLVGTVYQETIHLTANIFVIWYTIKIVVTKYDAHIGWQMGSLLGWLYDCMIVLPTTNWVPMVTLHLVYFEGAKLHNVVVCNNLPYKFIHSNFHTSPLTGRTPVYLALPQQQLECY